MKITIVKPSVICNTSDEIFRNIMPLLENAGRICYKSEDHITKHSANNFIKSIVKRGHESVIEHCVVSMTFIGSRTMSHQLVRHRLASYSQESQRYCNYGKKGLQLICPPTIADISEGTYDIEDQQQELSHSGWSWLSNRHAEYIEYLDYINEGIPPEDARCCLPNATKTEVFTTFNLRQWRSVLKERALNPHAQWEIRIMMLQALTILNKKLPAIFSDLYEEAYGETNE
jgi:thymidylate synthase (FAD)